jgi:hypothetical protein
MADHLAVPKGPDTYVPPLSRIFQMLLYGAVNRIVERTVYLAYFR